MREIGWQLGYGVGQDSDGREIEGMDRVV